MVYDQVCIENNSKRLALDEKELHRLKTINRDLKKGENGIIKGVGKLHT